jgi:hypothetical protein
MKRNNKEFEELRSQFEKDLKVMPLYVGGTMEREAKDSSQYYANGNVNNYFKLFMQGYQFAKSLARQDALELNG